MDVFRVVISLAERFLHRLARLSGATRDQLLISCVAPPLRSNTAGADLIADSIEKGNPWLCGRLGTPEANALLNSIEVDWCRSPSALQRFKARALGLRQQWDVNVVAQLNNNAGVFPADLKTASLWCRKYAAELTELDALAYWGRVPGESYILRTFCPTAAVFRASVLEPYLNPGRPWSRALKGKKVLVVHPFSDSILRQYERREHLFPDTEILPEFDLYSVRAVQSAAGTKTAYRDWFEALDAMKRKMDRIVYDVCLVGAGSYSTPLCAHAKRSGKVAIYVGGALQILFAVKGKRWDSMPAISKLYNEHWVRPSASERIPTADKIEGGCYW